MDERYILYTVYWSVLLFRPTLHKLLATFPLSFSYGEACVVVQGLLLAATGTVIPHYQDVFHLPRTVQAVALHCWERLPTTSLLVASWAGLVAVSVGVVAVYNSNNWPVNTVTRKLFHVAVMLVYIPGLSYSPLLLYAASLGAAGFMLLLETLRWSRRVPAIADTLDTALASFTDSKEGGSLILTHLYLLVGVSLPLWVWPHALTSPAPLALYSGVLSVGVADSAASLVGFLWGRTHWPNSNKTVEGSVGGVAAALASVLVMEAANLVSVTSWSRVVLATVATMAVEALTDQVDNLTLPFVMYSILRLTTSFI